MGTYATILVLFFSYVCGWVCVYMCVYTYGPWMIRKIFVRACRMACNVGFLQNLGSLVRLFLCEAISKYYSNSLKGPKCSNKQGIENLLCFLMCANRVSQVYIYIYIYIYIYTYTHTHKHTHTQTLYTQTVYIHKC